MGILRELTQQYLNATAEELDDLIAADLVLEMPVHAVRAFRDLDHLSRAYPLFFAEPGGVFAPGALQALQHHIREKLRSDWFRISSKKATLVSLEANNQALRLAQSALADPTTRLLVQKALQERQASTADIPFATCPAVGSGCFAVTQRGLRVLQSLEVRSPRVGPLQLQEFLRKFTKVEAKQEAFSRNIQELSAMVGPLRKGKVHVLVGLAKADLPVDRTAKLYRQALPHVTDPHQAVVCTRFAAPNNDLAPTLAKLGFAYQALRMAGVPDAPALREAAKSLMPFPSLDTAAIRFVELFRGLQQARLVGVELYKCTAQLMGARGMPFEVLQRVAWISHRLATAPYPPHSHTAVPDRTSVALVSLVTANTEIDPLCDRFFALQRELIDKSLGGARFVEELALSCVGSPGTPAEVVATVKSLARRIAGAEEVSQDHLIIAAAFAKRFAY